MSAWTLVLLSLTSLQAPASAVVDAEVAPTAWRATGKPYSVDLVVGEVDSRVLTGTRFRMRLGVLQGSANDTQTIFRCDFEAQAIAQGGSHD